MANADTPGPAEGITVDNIEVAQFVYLLLHNEKTRDVINTRTSKSVLILGRFAIPERNAILEALRNRLREYNRYQLFSILTVLPTRTLQKPSKP